VLLEMKDTAPLRVAVFREGRILWLVEPDSAVYKQLAATQQLKGGKYVFYSDITSESPSITIDGFEIVPALFGFLPQQARTIAALP
jgi:hypothetical protein